MLKPPPRGYRYIDITCEDCRKNTKHGGKCIGSTHKKGEKPKCPILQKKFAVPLR